MEAPFYLWIGTKGFPMWHKFNHNDDGTAIITGCDPGQVVAAGKNFKAAEIVTEVGEDGITKNVLGDAIWEVVEVLERRDHHGFFTRESDKKNSFFKVKVRRSK